MALAVNYHTLNINNNCRLPYQRISTNHLLNKTQPVNVTEGLSPVSSSSLPRGDLLNRILSFACTKGNATIVIRTPSSALTSAPPPRPSTCIYCPDDALAASTSVARRFKLWQSIRRSNGSRDSIRRRGTICTGVWGVHE